MKILPIALVALMLTLSAPSIHAATIFSDNFNTENGGVGELNYGGFANWTVTGGTVDLIGNGFFDFFPSNGLFIDLDGTSLQSGALTSSAFSLAAGTYTLRFELAGSQRGNIDTVLVTLGSLYSESFTFASADPLTLFTRSIVVGAPTSASLTFQDAGDDNIGAILDNVSLDEDSPSNIPVETPEPASIAMLALGLAGIGLARKRSSR